MRMILFEAECAPPESTKMPSATANPPAKPAAVSAAPLSPNTTSPVTAAALAPSVTPITSGLASGLRSMDWKAAPEPPRASPAPSATSAVGSLVSRKMKLAGPRSAPSRIRTASTAEIW